LSELSGAALVTGGGRGIGRVIAERLAGAGMRVAVAARTAADVEEVATATGGLALVLDVADASACEAAVARIEGELGPLALLVNNAGMGGSGAPTWEQELSAWRRVLEVNFLGAVACTTAALRRMAPRGAGRVVNMASNAAFYRVGDEPEMPAISSAYMASKAALVRWTEALAYEARPFGVTVFAVSPGMVWTEMTRETFADWPHEHTWSRPELAADLVAFIASGALDRLSGRYVHARADDWRSLPDHASAILADDRLALRLSR
jgi:NAD(P)-dependent dehydrogenase (short-subunit alcohol dehydrogenase family)